MYTSTSTQRNILSVAKLNKMVGSLLKTHVGQVWISAEISNFVAAASGHWYFTLKDRDAQVKAAMFKGANGRIAQRPKEGDSVLVRANVGLYEPRGDYQIIVEHLEFDGAGLLKQQYEQLKNALQAEGLFATQTKQAIPQDIKTVGIITSATGAALHDITTVLKRRNPMINVIVYPTQVQGAAAAAQIVNAIFIANRRREVDVLIVGRGGGSLEDLWCFNEETVARAIFGSHLPIVSAVGHEVDVTIADFVADLRAATPSQAAELVSSDLGDVIYTIEQWRQRLTQAISTKLNECDYQQQLLGSRLQQNHPQQRLQQQAQAIDHFTMQLQHNMQRRLQVAQQRQQHLENRLQHLSPIHLVSQSQQHTHTLTERLRQAMANRLTHQQQRFAKVTGILHSVSPLATLSRGYSISFVDNHVVNTTSTIKEGDTLTTRLTDGEVTSKVERISAVK
ncbi:exodeoxyribonuclease VII large subunit [Glaciecola sp. HTCC2999]|uniref:exodeoxyribonuclease VII large subunit n=1 Tax=Glaciecola sp. HTCC2999 TaxID=455436 RepID=UPI0000E0F4FB|nr:exodeoxyribonuclease VII large subunit [Glaciecola sp. HTCC2999]